MTEVHPRHAGYRVARRLRGLRSVRGWRRIADALAPFGLEAPFRVTNGSVVFEGNVSSFVDREIYLFGQYEHDAIAMFLAMVPPDRRRVAIDVGANIGNHSLAFSQNFSVVHAFEPNEMLWTQFQRNMAINGKTNVTLHRVGLGQQSGTYPFYLTEKKNYGLGTFSSAEQYDAPLRQVGTFRVEQGDAYLDAQRINDVDAIKIDTQGLEAEVLAGLGATLARTRPVVWFELGHLTAKQFPRVAEVRRLFPYPVEFRELGAAAGLLTYTPVARRLQDHDATPPGDIVALPVS